jgi:glycosyltransferase involved in cell wall biosynthesis
MKVLHLVKTVDGATWALRQMTALRARGIDVIVALPSATAGLAPGYAERGITVVAADLDVPARRPWRLAGAIGRCRRLVATTEPDLIHSHFVATTLVARLALGRAHPIPRVFQVPGPLHLEHATFRSLDLATAGPRDLWVGSCRWTVDEYRRRGIDPARLALSYYGTDLGAFEAAAPGALRRELGIAAGTPLVGMVAYMYPPKRFLGQQRGLKGHEDLIDAFRTIARALPGVRLVLAGDQWGGGRRYAARIAARARAAGGDSIHVLGTRRDVAAIYADLDVAVHPSLSENCGGAVESLAAGCPTVATAVGGLPDVVRDGETGWLVPPCDPPRLATAVIAALGDRVEARRRALAGRAHVRSLFAIDNTAAEIAALYERVLSSTGAGAARAGGERPTLPMTRPTAGTATAIAPAAPPLPRGAYACTP